MTDRSDAAANFVMRVSKALSDDDVDFVRKALEASLGAVEVGSKLPAGSRQVGPWEVLVVANASVFLAAFMKRSGENAAEGLLSLIKSIGSRMPGEGRVLVQDHDEEDRIEFNVRTVTIEEVRITLRAFPDASRPTNRR